MLTTEEDHGKMETAATAAGSEGKLANAKMDWDINDNHFPKLQQVKNCACLPAGWRRCPILNGSSPSERRMNGFWGKSQIGSAPIMKVMG